MGRTRFFAASRAAVALVATLALIGSSGAATTQEAYARLTQIAGSVLVDTGDGFLPVTDDVALKLGDRVMVADQGRAVLDLGQDCAISLSSPSMTTVTETACTTSTQGSANYIGPAIGIAGIAAGAALLIWCAADLCRSEKSESP